MRNSSLLKKLLVVSGFLTLISLIIAVIVKAVRYNRCSSEYDLDDDLFDEDDLDFEDECCLDTDDMKLDAQSNPT